MSNITIESHTDKIKKFVKPYSKFSSYLAHIRVEFDQAKMKLLIIFFILLFNGSTSVISQVYLTDILKLAGFELKNPVQPNLFSFLLDFLGDTSIYVLIIILLGMGTFSSELEVNKQVYFTLSRPISRAGYYFTRTLVFTIGIAFIVMVGSGIVYIYSILFFDPIAIEKMILILLMVSLQYSAFYAIMIMFSARYNQTVAGVLGFLTLVSLIIVSILPPLKWFSFLALSSDWVKIFNNSISSFDLGLDFLALLIWILIPIIIGWKMYIKRDL